jgi:hypothetical protein
MAVASSQAFYRVGRMEGKASQKFYYQKNLLKIPVKISSHKNSPSAATQPCLIFQPTLYLAHRLNAL